MSRTPLVRPSLESNDHPGPGLPSSPAALIHLGCADCGQRQILRVPSDRGRSEARLEGLLPRVPVRHWVLSPGPSAQPRLALRPRIHDRIARACVAAVFAERRRAAARAGLVGPVQCGALSAIPRDGTPLEPHVHIHLLVLDGVYRERSRSDPTPEFVPLPAPRRRDLRRLLGELRPTIDSILARATDRARTSRRVSCPRSRAGLPHGPNPARTRAVHRVTEGPRVYASPQLDPSGALIQRARALEVFAGAPISADDLARWAQRCRDLARATFDPGALGSDSTGRLRYRLHRPFADGTTHVEFSTHALAERLIALTKSSGRPTLAFHGIVAPNATARAQRAGPLSIPGTAAPNAARPRPLRCRACQGLLDIVRVEPANQAA